MYKRQEFTIEDGHLYMLQTRNGKRTAQAALQIACDLVDEGMITEDVYKRQGEVGNPKCGDIMRMYLKIENNVIVDRCV